jgi:hypothetical protein
MSLAVTGAAVMAGSAAVSRLAAPMRTTPGALAVRALPVTAGKVAANAFVSRARAKMAEEVKLARHDVLKDEIGV